MPIMLYRFNSGIKTIKLSDQLICLSITRKNLIFHTNEFCSSFKFTVQSIRFIAYVAYDNTILNAISVKTEI